MSSLIEQAILDAKELKEAAIKSAEQMIIEKYADEFKNSIEQLLEQDLGGIPAMPGAITPAPLPVDPARAKADKDQIPTQIEYAAFDGMTIGKTKYPELNEEIEIDLTSLSEYELDPTKGPTKRNIKESVEISEEELMEMLADTSAGENESDKYASDYVYEEEVLEEEEELSDEELENLLANLSTSGEEEAEDYETSEKADAEIGKEAASEADEEEEIVDELKEEITIEFNENYIAGRDYGLGANTAEDTHVLQLSQLHDEAESLKQQNESLKQKLKEATKLIAEATTEIATMKESFHDMKGKLAEVQLINAKLLFSNKVLSNASLNERQKNKIVESLTTAESIEKVKIVYETLQSAVEDNTYKAPKSLSEAVSRRSSPLLLKSSSRENMDANPVNDTLSRMKILAGIKK